MIGAYFFKSKSNQTQGLCRMIWEHVEPCDADLKYFGHLLKADKINIYETRKSIYDVLFIDANCIRVINL